MPRAQQVLPKYLQIANSIRDEIFDGKLRPGDEVRSERELAAEWSVARPTAARALAELRRLGLVDSVRGSGTFVTGAGVAHRAHERFGSFHARIISAEMVPGSSAVTQALGLPDGAELIRRRRVTMEGDRANETSVSWFDGALADVAPRLVESERIREGTTAYVEQVTGRVAKTGEDRECARRATAEEAELLGIGRNSPVLVTEHRVVDAAGVPLEWAESACPPGRWTPFRQYRFRP
jgi:DNA-binding GntR family transcriptional regulator